MANQAMVAESGFLEWMIVRRRPHIATVTP
ncbi:hypothetical protein Q31b_58230 [Novipirellula aureliae]|uniref:Uncharacterized protein n=1 Tax=Novipirellula aureliae TaxID=2527966 RepID=A0A5C6D950_9BACT|nr:hypothetical protein Q31b_58230 [Novipirellula aureliae]